MDPVSHLLLARMVAAVRIVARAATRRRRGDGARRPRARHRRRADGCRMGRLPALARARHACLRWHAAGRDAHRRRRADVGAGDVARGTRVGGLARRPESRRSSTSTRARRFGCCGRSRRTPSRCRSWRWPIRWRSACCLLGALALWIWPRVPRTAVVLVIALLVVVSGVKLATRASAATAYMRVASAQAQAGRCDRGGGVGIMDGLAVLRPPAGRADSLVAADGWTGDARLRFEQEPTRGRPVRAALARRVRDGSQLPAGASLRLCDMARQRQRRRRVLVRCALLLDGRRARRRAGRRAAPGRASGARSAALRVVVRRLLDAQGGRIEALVWLGGHLQRRSPGSWAIEKDGGRRREDGGREEDED